MFDIFSINKKEKANNKLNIQHVDFRDIKTNEKNFFELDKIDILAEDILENGIEKPITVYAEANHYVIIDGERRFTAFKQNLKNGKSNDILVPVIIKENLEDAQIEERLILSNLTSREISNADKLKSIERLEQIYKNKKEMNKIPKRIRTLIAEATNLKETQVGKYQAINKKATEEMKAKINKNELTIEQAYKLVQKTNKSEKNTSAKTEIQEINDQLKKQYNQFGKLLVKLGYDKEFLKNYEEKVYAIHAILKQVNNEQNEN